jgi:hypothetical protein
MSNSVRTYLTTGAAAALVSTMALSPVAGSEVPSGPRAMTRSAASVELTAAVKPLVVQPMTIQQLATARSAIAALDPAAARRLPDPAALAAVPAPQNAASDFIVSVYQGIQYWVDYGVQLADYVLGFIPLGGLISSQVNIVYGTLIRPISDSIVYQLIVPVVNDPLNPASYVNGLIAVGQAAINGLVNAAVAEFNYFIGGLIPPLPPFPFAAKLADVEAQPGLPAAKPGPFGALAELASEVEEHVKELTTLPKPRPAATGAIEAALKPALAALTKDRVTATADATADAPANDTQKSTLASELKKRWSARRTDKSEQAADVDAGTSTTTKTSTIKTKLRPTHQDATESSKTSKTSDGSAQSKAGAARGAKDGAHRGARHVKAGAKG